LEINSGPNCLGQGWRANATLGRALRLVLQNVGAALPGIGDMATQGQPGKYSWCLAENEAESPWPPFSAIRGIPPGASAVTAVGAAGSMEVVLTGDDPEQLIERLAHAVRAGDGPGRSETSAARQVAVLLPPESARYFQGHGWDRQRLAAEIARRTGQAATGMDRLDPRGTEPPPATGDGRAPEQGAAVRSDGDILIVVAGGTGIKATVVPAWSGVTRAVTRIIVEG
jgi:hypothetical protein